MLKQGIILIATGHVNYGRMAYNLALTIKAVEAVDIAVVCDDIALQHLTMQQQLIFSHVIALPVDYRNGFGTKLHLDQLTPFEKTLYLDADMLWLSKKPSQLFAELAGIPFTIITEGNSDAVNNKYYFWADPKEIKSVYNVAKVWQTRSEVIYFEKGTKVFEQARVVDVSPLKTIRMFSTHVPDELYFNIAMAQLKVSPHIPNWKPAYWARLNNEVMPNLSLLVQQYYLLSFGSNIASPPMKRAYDNVMQVACNKLGFPYLFHLKSKKEWAPGRLKI